MFKVISSPAVNVLSYAEFNSYAEAEAYAQALEDDGILVTSIREH